MAFTSRLVMVFGFAPNQRADALEFFLRVVVDDDLSPLGGAGTNQARPCRIAGAGALPARQCEATLGSGE